MIKTRTDSALKIWSKDVINKFETLPEEQEKFVIIQIEHAYDSMFVVEIIRKSRLHDDAIGVVYPPADMNIYPALYSAQRLCDIHPTMYE